MAVIVTTNGLNNIVKQTLGISGGLEQLYFEVGTGTLTPALGTTALTTALSPRVALTNTQSGGVGTLEAFFTNSQVNGTLTEWAIYSALTGGTLLACGNFSPSVVKTSSQTLTVTVTETFANG